MRFLIVAALALALAACGNDGGSEDEQLSTDRSDISAAQIDAALGPEDQSTIRDAGTDVALEDALGNDAAPDDEASSEGEQR